MIKLIFINIYRMVITICIIDMINIIIGPHFTEKISQWAGNVINKSSEYSSTRYVTFLKQNRETTEGYSS